MFGLMKRAVKSKEKKKKAVFTSFGEKQKRGENLQPASYGNCDCRGGKLRGGIGVKKYLNENGEEVSVKLSSIDDALYTFFTVVNRNGEVEDKPYLYILAENGYMYERHEYTGNGWQRVLLGNHIDHCALKAENKAIYNLFSGEKGAYYSLDGGYFYSIYEGKCLGGCICGKRYLILTGKGELLYSAALMPTSMQGENPNGGGVIYLPAGYGAPVGMKSYGDSAYIFLERGIFKLTLSATATENTLEEIPYGGGNICLRAMAVTGEGILFLAKEGLYRLRGDKVERICEYLPIGPCDTGKACRVAYCDELVVFDYYKQTGEGEEVRRLVVYADGKDGYFSEVYGSLGGNQYTYMQRNVYYFEKDCKEIQHAETPFFTSERLDFGTDKKKCLKTLTLKGKGSVTVGVRCGEMEKTYPLVFENGVAQARLQNSGKEFSFTFYLDGGCTIEGMQVEYVTGG